VSSPSTNAVYGRAPAPDEGVVLESDPERCPPMCCGIEGTAVPEELLAPAGRLFNEMVNSRSRSSMPARRFPK
jgi:hypothetical protein